MTIEFTSQHTLGPHAVNQRDGAVLIDGLPIEVQGFHPGEMGLERAGASGGGYPLLWLPH